MKNLYIIIAFLSYSLCVSAQEPENTTPGLITNFVPQNTTNLKSANELVYLKDSTISYLLSSSSVWEVFHKIFYLYDERGNNIEYLRKDADADSGDFVENYKNCWVYNSQDIMLNFYQLAWNKTTSSWDSTYHVKYLSDENGFLTGDVTTGFNADSGKWINTYAKFYTNNANGSIDEYILKRWEKSSLAWLNFIKYKYTYNSNGLVTGKLSQKWVSSSWADNTKTIYTYDASNVLSETKVYAWDSETSVWENFRYYEYTNNANGLVIDFVLQVWDKENSAFVNTNRYKYTYDEFGNNTEYNPGYWDKDNSVWKMNNKDVNFYSQHNKTNTGIVRLENRMAIFPNPAKSEIHVENIAEPSVITILNINGKQIIQRQVNSGNTVFSLNNYRAGWYILRINNLSGQQTTKFVKR